MIFAKNNLEFYLKIYGYKYKQHVYPIEIHWWSSFASKTRRIYFSKRNFTDFNQHRMADFNQHRIDLIKKIPWMMEENTELKTTTCNIYIERNSEQPCYNYQKWHTAIGGTVCTWNFTCSPSKTCSLALFCGAVAIRFYDLCKLPHISNHAKTCNRFLSFIDFVVDIHIRPMQHSAGFLFYWKTKSHRMGSKNRKCICVSLLWSLFFEYAFRTLFIFM